MSKRTSNIWFITGSACGIGAEIAKAALAAGDRVVATGRNVEQLERIYAKYGDKVLAAALDVSEADQALVAVEAAVARFGRIDVLVNNAGFGQLGPFEENEPLAIEQQFATNVFGTFHVTRAVLPVMRRQRAGYILNVSSIGGFIGSSGTSIYSSSKFAVEGFSESLALEVSGFGIKVTIVEPGFIRTDFLDKTSIRYGTKTVDGYAARSAEIRAYFGEHNHRQAGDPARLARTLVALAADANPPLRFMAGSDAIEMATGKLKAVSEEIAKWHQLSISTDGSPQSSKEAASSQSIDER
jgi:NAD(P)-dependent dehydrogenase (short-subunit alcohol dehydrogenase family)